MLAKLRSLLAPLSNLKNKGTIVRLGLAGAVLGVGGFAVYKGAQQMKPKRPAPKPTVTAANKLRARASAGDLDPNAAVSGASRIGTSADLNNSANASAQSLYDGGEQSPALSPDGVYGGGDQQVIAHEVLQENPDSVLQGDAVEPGGSEQYADNGSSAIAASPGRIRRPPTSPGSYHAADEASQDSAGQEQTAGQEY